MGLVTLGETGISLQSLIRVVYNYPVTGSQDEISHNAFLFILYKHDQSVLGNAAQLRLCALRTFSYVNNSLKRYSIV